VINGTSPFTYFWDFGDGTSSSEANPTHQFNAEGIYNITLTVTDTDGDTATYSRLITVLPLDDDIESLPEIPGYDLFVLFGMIVISTLVFTKMMYKRKKK
jgi:PKD repeat protein